MKAYNENHELAAIICNQCGRVMTVQDDMVKEGVFSAACTCGYFSEKDGEIHSLDLCEECYDEFIKHFKIPVTVTAQTEMV